MPTSPGDGDGAIVATLYRATHRKKRELGGVGWAAFQIADTFQRAVVDTAVEALTLQPSAAGRIGRAANDLVWESSTLLPLGTSPRQPLSEAAAIARVFTLVSDVRRTLGLPRGRFVLADAMLRAERLGFEGLWAIEGIGHDYAADHWRERGEAMSSLLVDSAIPARHLPMLHAGIGLFFAELLLHSVTPYSSLRAVAREGKAFEDRCSRNGVTGFLGLAFESLGLVTRTWFPQMMDALDRVLPGELRGYFWHGAGRALFFLPVHAVPGLLSAWTAAEREASDVESGLNLRTGLAWATTLVYLRWPRLLESVIRRRPDDISRDGAFAYGVRTTIAMAASESPADPALDALIEYAPVDASIARLWVECVRGPAIEGLRLARENARAAQPFLGLMARYRYPWEIVWE